MTTQPKTRVARRLGGFLLPAAVLVVAVALGITLWHRGDLNAVICDGDCGPSNVIPPRALTTESTPQVVSPAAVPAGALDPGKVSGAVASRLDATVLGPRVGFSAVSASDGTPLASSGSGAYVPASTTKVLTAFATLSSIDPQTTFTTRVVQSGDQLVLVGGGDPYLASRIGKKDPKVVRADLATLAGRTAAALKKSGRTTVELGYDASLFTGPGASPAWEPSYVSGNIVTPVSALWADQGVQRGVRSRDPAAAAARVFADLLERRGVTVTGEITSERAPAAADVVGSVRSATVAQIVEALIRTSDNQAAEVMLRQVAIAAGRPPTFDGGTAAVADVLDVAGIDADGLVLRDGSGLSRHNRITPLTLAETLRAAAAEPRTASLMADLPVSGFTGTLVDRFARLKEALGTVRAKTGTLTGVHSLAGYALDADGRPVFFAVMADDTDKTAPLESQAALDSVAAAIAACSCGT